MPPQHRWSHARDARRGPGGPRCPGIVLQNRLGVSISDDALFDDPTRTGWEPRPVRRAVSAGAGSRKQSSRSAMRSSGRARSGACSRTRFSPCPEHRLWAVTHSALMSRDDWNGGIAKLTVRVRFPSSAFMVDRSARRIAGQGRQRDRWRGYAWSTRLGERDGAVRDAQLRAGGALLAMTDDEGCPCGKRSNGAVAASHCGK